MMSGCGETGCASSVINECHHATMGRLSQVLECHVELRGASFPSPPSTS